MAISSSPIGSSCCGAVPSSPARFPARHWTVPSARVAWSSIASSCPHGAVAILSLRPRAVSQASCFGVSEVHITRVATPRAGDAWVIPALLDAGLPCTSFPPQTREVFTMRYATCHTWDSHDDTTVTFTGSPPIRQGHRLDHLDRA